MLWGCFEDFKLRIFFCQNVDPSNEIYTKREINLRNLPKKSLVPSRFEFPAQSSRNLPSCTREDYAGNSKLDGTKDFSGGFLRMIFR